MLDDRPYMRDSGSGPRFGRMPASIILILVCAVAFFVQLVVGLASGRAGHNVINLHLGITPDLWEHGWVWQLFTFQFLHAGALHLILNCLGLYMFGRPVEEAIGWRRFLLLYLGSGVVGGVVQAACMALFPVHFGLGAVLGASAGVFGIIAGFAMLNWETPITTLVAFIIPVTMRAKYLILVLAVIGVLGVLDARSGVAHAAHLGGLLAGLSFMKLKWHQDFRPLPGAGLFARLRRRPRFTIVRAAGSARAARASAATVLEDPPDNDFVSREVDPILDKIAAHGMQSLSEREKKVLERARARMSKR